jgi:hypothetical protein
MGKLTKGSVRSMTEMEMKKKDLLAELDLERREIEKEFEDAEPVEIEFARDLKITWLNAEESRRIEAGEHPRVVLGERR